MINVYGPDLDIEEANVNGKPGFVLYATAEEGEDELFFEDYYTLSNWAEELANQVKALDPINRQRAAEQVTP
jgi:hypothetical protein